MRFVTSVYFIVYYICHFLVITVYFCISCMFWRLSKLYDDMIYGRPYAAYRVFR